MAIDVSAPRSRRALLAATLGGLAATAAQAIGRPAAVLATDGQPVIQGQTNSGALSTVVAVANTTALQGVTDAPSGANYGVRGRSTSTAGAGVVGQTTATTGSNYGVRGFGASTNGGAGVRGEAPRTGVEGVATGGTGPAVGVRATTNSATGFGVDADNTAIADDATAIAGQAQGVAIYAVGTGSHAKGLLANATSPTGDTVAVDGSAASPLGIGVRGRGARGVFGTSDDGTGVHGWVGSFETPVPDSELRTGVHGQCDLDVNSRGVVGRSAGGIGVLGIGPNGTGVLAHSTFGNALRVEGKASFTRSGRATVLAGQTSVIVSPITLGSTSLVVATIQGPGASGLYVRNVSVSVANSRFTIRLSKAPAVNTLVGWFLVN